MPELDFIVIETSFLSLLNAFMPIVHTLFPIVTLERFLQLSEKYFFQPSSTPPTEPHITVRPLLGVLSRYPCRLETRKTAVNVEVMSSVEAR